MAGWLLEKPDAVFDGSGLGVLGREINAPQPHMRDGAGTHGAGLQRHIKIATIEPSGAAHLKGRADRHHFRMRRGIAQRLHAVSRRGENAVAFHDHCPHRRFAMSRRFLGEAQGTVQGGKRIGHGFQ